MIPTRDELDRWLHHLWGAKRLKRVRDPIREAIELDAKGRQIISTFRNRAFNAAVTFVDMRGFSSASQGRNGQAIASLVRPFLSAVIVSARDCSGLVDKTIGDEVMIVFPDFGEDASCSDGEWPSDDGALRSLHFLRALVAADSGRYKFSAGIAAGELWLDRVGVHGHYYEWSCYGQAVNAAARLRELAKKQRNSNGKNVFAFGVIGSAKDAEQCVGNYKELVEGMWRMKLFGRVRHRALRGVGDVTFVSGAV